MSNRDQVRTAESEVRCCADTLAKQAAILERTLPGLPMDAGLRTTALELAAGIRDTAGRVTFELAMLEANADEIGRDVRSVVRTLTDLDAAMMNALAPVAEIADRLEAAAESDHEQERAFVVLIEAAAEMLEALAQARSSTAALGDGGDGTRLGRGPAYP
jgi:hypothetical protein